MLQRLGPNWATPETGSTDLRLCCKKTKCVINTHNNKKKKIHTMKLLRQLCDVFSSTSDLWNCWNRFMGMKLMRVYLVVRMLLSWKPLEKLRYSEWCGSHRDTTSLLFPLSRWTWGSWASWLLLGGSDEGEEYQPLLLSVDISCKHRCWTQRSRSMRTAARQTGVAHVCTTNRSKHTENYYKFEEHSICNLTFLLLKQQQ